MKYAQVKRSVQLHAYCCCEDDYKKYKDGNFGMDIVADYCMELARASDPEYHFDATDIMDRVNEREIISHTTNAYFSRNYENRREQLENINKMISVEIIAYYTPLVKQLLEDGIEEYELDNKINIQEMAGIPQRGD